MRILAVTNYYPPYEVGGYEQLCHDVLGRLRGRGHEIAVVTSNHGVDRHNTTREPGVERVLRIQPRPDGPLNIPLQYFVTRKRAETYNRRVFSRIVENLSPDVVFIWNLQGLPMELATDAEGIPGLAVAYWLAGYTPAEPDQFWRYWMLPPGSRSFLEPVKGIVCRYALAQMMREGKPVCPQMNHVAVVSEYMRRSGLTNQTLPRHTRVIYNGIEVEQFYRPVRPCGDGALRLLLAGRISEDKGIDTAIEAMSLLAGEFAPGSIHLTLAGSGPQRFVTYVKQRIAQNGLEGLITMTGWLNRAEMPGLMAMAHVLLLPTTHAEPFARVVLEAMAAGLAVVATPTGGTPEIVQEGKTGLIHQPANARSLADQIAVLVVDDDLRQRLATEGQALVIRQFDLGVMVTEVEELLLEARTN